MFTSIAPLVFQYKYTLTSFITNINIPDKKSALVSAVSIFFHEIPHQMGDFCVMLKNGIPSLKVALVQLVSGSGAFLGGYIASSISSEYQQVTEVFCYISFIYTTYSSILSDMVNDENCLSYRLLVAECVFGFFGFWVVVNFEF